MEGRSWSRPGGSVYQALWQDGPRGPRTLNKEVGRWGGGGEGEVGMPDGCGLEQGWSAGGCQSSSAPGVTARGCKVCVCACVVRQLEPVLAARNAGGCSSGR